MEIRRLENGPTRRLIVVPEVIEPGEAFKTAMTQGTRIIERSGRRIGHVPIFSYAGGEYQETLVDLLSSGSLKDADAVIWDLRDGWGGARPSYLDVFVPQGAAMTLTERSGEVERENFRWRKPVALVINQGSRSGKEVLAHAFKEYKLGPVIGETTAGALLAGRAFILGGCRRVHAHDFEIRQAVGVMTGPLPALLGWSDTKRKDFEWSGRTAN